MRLPFGIFVSSATTPKTKLLLTLIATIAITCSPCFCSAGNKTSLREDIKTIEPCILQSVYSFFYTNSLPPTNREALGKSCKAQSEGFKCVRDKSRSTSGILRRGLLTFIQGRQRYHKKYCTNINGQQSSEFLSDFKCIVEKKLAVYSKIDADFGSTLLELVKRNYADASVELKYLCCTIINYRRAIIESVGPECTGSKARVEEMILSIVPNEISLICEDEDTLLTKVCPKLEPIKIPNTFKPKTGEGASVTSLYLVATLGEPEEA